MSLIKDFVDDVKTLFNLSSSILSVSNISLFSLSKILTFPFAIKLNFFPSTSRSSKIISRLLIFSNILPFETFKKFKFLLYSKVEPSIFKFLFLEIAVPLLALWCYYYMKRLDL